MLKEIGKFEFQSPIDPLEEGKVVNALINAGYTVTLMVDAWGVKTYQVTKDIWYGNTTATVM